MGCNFKGVQFPPITVHQVLLIILLLTSRSQSIIPPRTSRHNTLLDNTTYDPSSPHQPRADAKQIRWALAAYNYTQTVNCSDVFFTTEKECQNLVKIPRNETNVYLADPSTYDRLVTVLPDEVLDRSVYHDGVVVVDPYPGANFGHLVVAFFLDLRMDMDSCKSGDGIYLDGGECLSLALKRRCKNVLKRRNRRRNFARRCEINTLPLVHSAYDPVHKKQRLICRSNIPGFASCPKLRPENETLICNPLRDNTKRCETSRGVIHTSCRVFEICDKAVMISGGWNRWNSRMHHRDNVLEMYSMLQTYGFHHKNIKVFFANGAHRTEDEDRSHAGHEASGLSRLRGLVPSVMKQALRLHLQTLCSTPHCVDSLVLYLNSPALSDGSSLLWDADGDGRAASEEMYTPAELLHDLAGCAARQVYIIADQSYSGELVRAFRRSPGHHNVVVFASSSDDEYSYGNEYTRFWSHGNHTQTCMRDIQREAKRVMRRSSPENFIGENAARTTLFGAPCEMQPYFTAYELHQNYLGCQNLPSVMWFSKYMQRSHSLHDLDLSSQQRRSVSEQNSDNAARDV